eukprot:Clim_evm148s157 gene=Clim_evmTU148s157
MKHWAILSQVALASIVHAQNNTTVAEPSTETVLDTNTDSMLYLMMFVSVFAVIAIIAALCCIGTHTRFKPQDIYYGNDDAMKEMLAGYREDMAEKDAKDTGAGLMDINDMKR